VRHGVSRRFRLRFLRQVFAEVALGARQLHLAYQTVVGRAVVGNEVVRVSLLALRQYRVYVRPSVLVD
jgi:hypothetical protein